MPTGLGVHLKLNKLNWCKILSHCRKVCIRSVAIPFTFANCYVNVDIDMIL